MMGDDKDTATAVVEVFEFEDGTYERSGYCCRCGECCMGDPFEGAKGEPSIPGACPLLKLISAATNEHACIDRHDPYYLQACAHWPSHPGQIVNYPSCTYVFTKVG